MPDNAPRLFFGVPDAGGFQGNPSSFFDNSGSLTATFGFNIQSRVPEPSSLALLGTAALVSLRRHRRPEGRSRVDLREPGSLPLA